MGTANVRTPIGRLIVESVDGPENRRQLLEQGFVPEGNPDIGDIGTGGVITRNAVLRVVRT